MDQRLLAAPHGFSQRATSFIASWCQGIHRTPFSCSQLRECQTEVQHSHLAQEPSNLLAKVRPIPIHMPPHADQLREQPTGRDGRAIKHIHSLHASEHLRLRGLGSLSRSSSGQTCNRRVQTRQTLIHMSKEQKTRTFLRRPSPHPYDHRPATSQEAPLNAHTICFPTATASLLPEQSSLWRWTVSNRRPPACKAGALPLSYTPRRHKQTEESASFCKKKQKLPSIPVRTIQSWWDPSSRMTHHRKPGGPGRI